MVTILLLKNWDYISSLINTYHLCTFVDNSGLRKVFLSWMDLPLPPNNVTEFVLLGFTQNPHLRKIFFIVFLFIFLFTLLSNMFIVIIISLSPTLSAPMYFFLTYLAFIDTSLSSVTTPKITIDLLYQRRAISWGGCMTQFFLNWVTRLGV